MFETFEKSQRVEDIARQGAGDATSRIVTWCARARDGGPAQPSRRWVNALHRDMAESDLVLARRMYTSPSGQHRLIGVMVGVGHGVNEADRLRLGGWLQARAWSGGTAHGEPTWVPLWTHVGPVLPMRGLFSSDICNELPPGEPTAPPAARQEALAAWNAQWLDLTCQALVKRCEHAFERIRWADERA
jgi:hypothetical protein